jgi:PDZ domain-containing secreted protein
MWILRMVSGALLALLSSSAVAFAQSSPGGGGDANVQAQVTGKQVSQAGTLPFTGVELTLAVAVGLFLLALGFVLRRYGRSSTTTS